MAKTGSVQRNNKRKKLAKSFSAKRADLKTKIYNKSTPLEERFEMVLKLAAMPRNSAKTRVRNRCNLTGRPRSYYRKFGLSRIKIRELAGVGCLPGVVKASW